MRFILHVFTRDPWKTPWLVHIDGKDIQVKNVAVKVPTHTKNADHTPCANWYLEGNCRSYEFSEDKEFLFLED